VTIDAPRGVAAVAIAALLALGVAHGTTSPPVDAQSNAVSLRLLHRHDRVINDFRAGAGTTEAFSTVAIGDVTGNGSPNLVTGGMDGRVRVYRSDGSLVLDHPTGDGAIQASPVLVDLDGNGVLDILVATMSRTDPRVLGFDSSGRRLFSAGAAPRSSGYPPGFFATPVAGDIDRDGQIEIVAAGFDHNVHAWNLDGTPLPGFPRFVYDTVWSSPVLADIDGDGRLEIVVGGDMDAYPGAPLPPGGVLWALRPDGTNAPGYPRSIPGQTVWSSPAVDDINGDGRPDIVVGTGLNWPTAGRQVHAFDGPTGHPLAGWPVAVPGRVMASPAIGDLTGDGRHEVVVMTEGGWVVALNGGGGTIWRTCNRSNRSACDNTAATHGSVALADVTGNGRQEVIAASEHWLRVFDGRDKSVLAEFAMPNVWAPASTPTVAEVEGRTWIALNTLVNDGPAGRGAGDREVVWVWTTNRALGSADWPTFQRDARRSGSNHSSPGATLPAGCLAWGGGGVQRLYTAYFLRAPDQAGFAYWLDQRRRGVHLGTISSAFATSREFSDTYGALDDPAFLRLVYRNVMQREPDAAGFAYWSDLMSRRVLGRAGVMVNFSESREYRAATGDCP
jgi:hypothetical protein